MRVYIHTVCVCDCSVALLVYHGIWQQLQQKWPGGVPHYSPVLKKWVPQRLLLMPVWNSCLRDVMYQIKPFSQLIHMSFPRRERDGHAQILSRAVLCRFHQHYTWTYTNPPPPPHTHTTHTLIHAHTTHTHTHTHTHTCTYKHTMEYTHTHVHTYAISYAHIGCMSSLWQ